MSRKRFALLVLLFLVGVANPSSSARSLRSNDENLLELEHSLDHSPSVSSSSFPSSSAVSSTSSSFPSLSAQSTGSSQATAYTFNYSASHVEARKLFSSYHMDNIDEHVRPPASRKKHKHHGGAPGSGRHDEHHIKYREKMAALRNKAEGETGNQSHVWTNINSWK